MRGSGPFNNVSLAKCKVETELSQRREKEEREGERGERAEREI